LSNLSQAYTGSPLYPTATTSPAGLAITWTNAPQTNAGSYSVTATINDSSYTGAASGTFVITPVTPTVKQLADGECDHLRAGAVGLDAEWRQCDGAGELRVHGAFDGAGAVGSYSAAVTFTPTDTTNYTSVSGNVNVTVNAANASVVLSNLSQAYTGSPLYPTATTSPAGLAITGPTRRRPTRAATA